MTLQKYILQEIYKADKSEIDHIKKISIKRGFYRSRPEFKYNMWMPTKLSEYLWLLTRTEDFMEFFGEWVDIETNESLLDKNECSKFVIDDEPQLFYHFSDHDFDKFKTPQEIEDEDIEISKYRDTGSHGIYFTDDPKDAYKNFYGSNEYHCFLYSSGIKRITSATYDITPDTLYQKDYENLLRSGYDALYGIGEAVVFEPDQIFIAKKK